VPGNFKEEVPMIESSRKRPPRISTPLVAPFVLGVFNSCCLASPYFTITDLGAITSASSSTQGTYAPVLGVNGTGQQYVLAADGSTAYAFQRSSIDHGEVPNINPYFPPFLQPDVPGSRLINQFTVNSQGWAVGLGGRDGSLNGWYFLFNPTNSGGFVNLGNYPPWVHTVNDINASNIVAGSFNLIYSIENGQKVYTTDPIMQGVAYQLESRAAILDPKGTAWLDLNTRIPSGSGWFLTEALKIDDSGQVIGLGTLNNVPHAFLLTPDGAPTQVTVPEPTPLALLGLITVGLLWRRSHQRI